MNEDFFGIKREEEPVQDLYAEEQEAKNGRAIKHVEGGGKKFRGKGGSGMGGNGKILGIAVVLSLLIALACSWFMVQMLGATKSDVNGVITTVNGLSTRVGDVEDTGLTPADLDGLATESFVTGKGYTTVTSVDAKISALNTSLLTAIGGGVVSPTPVATGPKVTLMSGGCNVSVNGSFVSNTSVNVSSGKIWTKDITGTSVINLTASADTLHPYYGTFTGWNVNGLIYSSSVNPLSINVSASDSIVVSAISNGYGNLVTYTLTSNVSPSGSGTVTMSGSNPYVGLSVVNIGAIPASGYTFSNWTSTPSGATFGNATQASTTVTASGNYVLNANFVSCLATVPSIVSPSNGAVNVSHVSGSVTLDWSDSSTISIDGYRVTIAGGSPFMIRSYSVSASSYPVTVTGNSSYSWSVESKGCTGSVYGDWWAFTTD